MLRVLGLGFSAVGFRVQVLNFRVRGRFLWERVATGVSVQEPYLGVLQFVM